MYLPKHFEAPPAAALSLIRRHPLGQAVWQDAAGALQATPLPWLLASDDQPLRLRAHLPRANPLVARLAAGPAALLVSFQGPDAYVSPTWYPSKAQTERMVPTWNYACVVAHGRASLHEDADWVLAQIEALTAQQEARQPQPWRVGDAAPGFVAKLLRVLVGVELVVERLEAKFKLDQNSSATDRAGVAAGLQAAGDPASLGLLALSRDLLA